jgi:hypothetical protein
VSVPTAELAAPAPPRAEPAVPSSPPRRLSGGRLYLAFGAFALLVAVLSLLIPSTPSYDPWAWLVWGREVVHLDLHTTGGPSWKPLTVIFTAVLALFGKAAPDLWLVVARAGAVMAVLMTFKIAWRIARGLFGGPLRAGRAGATTALPVLFAATVAAASLVNSPAFVSDNALGYSEGLMTALVLIALDRHLDGARRQAFVVGFFAALDRPELWLLWGPYGLYLWWKDPGARKLVAGLFVTVPVLWFGPELWGSGHLFRGVTRAHHPRSNSAAFAKCPFCKEFVHHAWPRVMFRLKAVGLLAIAIAAGGLWPMRHALLGRRPLAPGGAARLLLLLVGVIGWLWWIGVSVETQAGFSGNDRYLVLGTALISIAGGVGWGWAAAAVGRLLRRLGPARTPAVAATAGTATLGAAVVLIATPPWIGPSILDVPATHRSLNYQAKLRTDLGRAIRDLGGPARILGCGTVMAEGFQVPMIAYELGVRTMRVEAPPSSIAPAPWPNVIFQTRDTRHAALLPLPAQIIAWEHDGARYSYRHIRTFRVFSACANKA